MIFLVLFLSLITTSRVYGEVSGLSSFIEYKNNIALLSHDLERLRLISDQKNDQDLNGLLEKFEDLKNSYEVIRSPLKLEKFSSDASENGWQQTSEKTLTIIPICEGELKDVSVCQSEIASIKKFVLSSAMNSESKEIVVNFFNSYLDEIEVLSTFNEVFINSFNQKINVVNSKYFSKPQPAITVKIVKKKEGLSGDPWSGFFKIIRQSYTKEIVYVFLGVLTALVVATFLVRGRRKRSLKKVYAHIFQVAKSTGVKVRLFGALDSKGLRIYNRVDKGLMESIVCLKNAFGTSFSEAHLKFNSTNNSLNIEIHYFIEKSITLTSLIKSDNEKIKEKFKKIEKIVSSMSGEVFYTNHLSYGDVDKTCLVAKIPLSVRF